MQLKLKVGKISAVLFNFLCFHSTTNNIFSVIKTTKGTHLTAKDKTETNNYIQPTFHIHFLFMYIIVYEQKTFVRPDLSSFSLFLNIMLDVRSALRSRTDKCIIFLNHALNS